MKKSINIYGGINIENNNGENVTYYHNEVAYGELIKQLLGRKIAEGSPLSEAQVEVASELGSKIGDEFENKSKLRGFIETVGKKATDASVKAVIAEMLDILV